MFVCQVHISKRASVATVIYTIIWNRICQICYILRKLRNQNNATTSKKLFYDLHTALIDCEKNLTLFTGSDNKFSNFFYILNNFHDFSNQKNKPIAVKIITMIVLNYLWKLVNL